MRKLAVALLFLGSVSAVGQVSDTVFVQVVEVPVTVAGGDGKAVRGLTKENFQLFDEGKRVPIEYFEVLEMKALATPKKNERPPAVAIRNFLLLFDLANSSPGAIRRAGDAAREFVSTQLGTYDLAAVATFTAEDGLKMITSFTADRKMLEAAIATLGNPKYFKVADPLMISFHDTSKLSDLAITSSDGADESRTAARRELKLDMEIAKETVLDPSTANKVRQQSQDAEQRNRLRIQLSNMGNIARMLDRLHGRKQVILLSEGFDHRLVQGEETRTDQNRLEDDQKRLQGEVWNVDNDSRFGSASASRDVSDMVQLFRRSDVVLHAIDIRGLRGNVDAGARAAGSAGRSNESLFLITRPTGGTVFQNSNDFAGTFARMLEQQEVVYLLGFTAKSGKNPGAFRDLDVKVDVKGARVSHRAGYYEPSNAASNIEKTLSTAEILLTDAPVRDLDVSIAATAIPGNEGKARVPVMIELPGTKLLEGLRSGTATANLFIYAFDHGNRVHDYLTQRISLDLTQAADALRATGLRYYGTLRLPPGEYAIKIVARVEDTNRAGFARTNLTVPAFASGAISAPLFVEEPADWLMLTGPKRGDDYPYPFTAAGTTYVPRHRPALQAAGEYKVALLAWGVSTEGLGLSPVIVRPDGSTQPAALSIVGRTPVDDFGDSKILFAFKPHGLAPGNYELRLGLKPQASAEAQYSLPFSVQ